MTRLSTPEDKKFLISVLIMVIELEMKSLVICLEQEE